MAKSKAIEPPGYEKRVACFIDILGFGRIVRSTLDSAGEPNRERVEWLRRTFALIRHHLGLEESQRGDRPIRATQFSDSIVLSFPYRQKSGVWDALVSILHLLIDLADHEILCRGGIAAGWLLHTDDTLFGPALVDAYELETKAAQYPRVILDEAIISIAREHTAGHHTAADEEAYVKEVVRKDSDGMYYVDYIEAAYGELNDPEYDYPGYLSTLRRLIVVGLATSDHGVRIKYGWLRERYNAALQRCRTACDDGRIRDPEVVEAYASLDFI